MKAHQHESVLLNNGFMLSDLLTPASCIFTEQERDKMSYLDNIRNFSIIAHIITANPPWPTDSSRRQGLLRPAT